MTNVLLITIDSLRADFVGSVGEQKETPTPNLDKFAKESIIFKNAFSPGPYTTVAMPSFFTGKYPSRLNVIDFVDIPGVYIKDEETIASILLEEGYSTIGIHSNPFLSDIFNFHKGFEDFYDDLFLKGLKLPEKVKLLINRIRRLVRTQPYLSAEGVNKKAIKKLKRTKKPFFMWLHYMDPHGPYQSKKGFGYLNKIRGERLWRKASRNPGAITEREKNILVSDYKEEVEHLDKNLGEFFEWIEREGFLKDTIVVICSDHGDAFGEHGEFSHPHKLYDELIRVPLIVWHPEYRGKVIEKEVSLVDVVPTILDILDINNEKRGFDGYSMVKLIRGEESNFRGYIISESDLLPKYHGCIRTANWKLILNANDQKKMLYDLKEDETERQSCIKEYPEIAKDLEKKLLQHKEGSSAEIVKGDQKVMDEEIKQRLRDLGYL